MKLLQKLKTRRALKEIQNDVDKELMTLGLLKIENNKKVYALGSCHTEWAIQKRILKEKYNIDWKSPQDKNPHITFD